VPATSFGWIRQPRISFRAVAAVVLFVGLTAPARSDGAREAESPPGLHFVPLGGAWAYTVALDSDGTPWIAGSADATHVTTDGRVVRYRLPLRADTYVSAWAGGAFWMVDEEIGGVIRVTPDGHFTRHPAIWGSDQPEYDYPPGDMIEGPDGTAWLDDRQRQRIVSVAADGTTRTVAPFDGDVFPEFLGVGADGSVWFSDTGNADQFSLAAAPARTFGERRSVRPRDGPAADTALTLHAVVNVRENRPQMKAWQGPRLAPKIAAKSPELDVFPASRV
jgi:streptogramin lyase